MDQLRNFKDESSKTLKQAALSVQDMLDKSREEGTIFRPVVEQSAFYLNKAHQVNLVLKEQLAIDRIETRASIATRISSVRSAVVENPEKIPLIFGAFTFLGGKKLGLKSSHCVTSSIFCVGAGFVALFQL